MLVPTHIFKPGNMGTAGRTGGTICSFSSRTWGLWMAGKKRHPISKIPLSGPSCEEFPPLQLLLCPLLLSSSLLFFFNQAVWGCQVFWDEDSQPCEKLIPCGPSSLWRSSPWEHWWWLAGRWWSTEGGGMDGEMKGAWTEGHLTSRRSRSDSKSDSEAHTWSYISAVAHFAPLPPKHHIQTSILSSVPVSYLPFLSIPNSKTFWWGSLPDHQTAGMESREDLRCGGLVEWPLEDDSGSQERKYSSCIVSQTSLAEALTPLPIHPTPQPLGFNRFSLVVPLCVKATILTDSSWAPCQGMKDMIDNNGSKMRCSTELFSGAASAPGTCCHKAVESLGAGRLKNIAHKAFSWKTEETEKWMSECFACSAVFLPLPPSQSKALLEI